MILITLATQFIFNSLLLQSTAQAYSTDPVKKGLEIAQNLDKQENGFKDFQCNMEMILRDRKGRESKRSIRLKTLEVTNDGDKSLTIFNTPKTVKGTKFLSFTHKQGSDDQWLYLPKIKRVKRIASNNKSGPFMGSEFAYEDIASQEVEKYTYKFVKEEACGKETCFVIDRVPTDKGSGYSKLVTWITKGEGNLKPVKIEFYDVKDVHLKTLETTQYKKYKDKFWRAGLFKMTNHVTGKSTDLVFTDYKYSTGLTEKDFNKSALKR